MKFNVAWASVLSENNLLKTTVAILGVVSVVFSVALARLAVRQPLLLERECGTRYISPVDQKHTSREIDSFIKTAVPLRFDTEAADFRSLLSDDEAGFRIKEQDELKKKSISQRVLVNSIKADGDFYVVDTDRVLSSGKVRSALPLIVKVQLASVGRSVSNPFGLILKRVSQVSQQGEVK